MKYVMFEADFGEGIKKHIPIIFPKDLVHREIARAMMPVFKRAGFEARPTSAGEVRVEGGEFRCFGKSTTLKLEAHRDDGLVITTYDYLHGMV